MSSRVRLRELGISIGRHPTGHYNAITDVTGVEVGHLTLIEDSPHVIRTGVTMRARYLGQRGLWGIFFLQWQW